MYRSLNFPKGGFALRSTLFYVPHELAGIPLFGVGLGLAAITFALVAWLGWGFAQRRRPADMLASAPVWLIGSAIVLFVLPAVEARAADGMPIGLPVRGYGVMVLLGLLLGVGITIYRGRQLGVSQDHIIGLGFWMMLGGVLGARVFYVLQKWETFTGETFVERLIDAAKVTEGGLVIYGGVIGGLVSGWFFCHRNKLPLRATADLIAPGFLIGLSAGRIGCLLHGCCFGGVCESNLPAIRFPHGSIPYASQMQDGSLLGIKLAGQNGFPATIESIEPDSPAAAAHIPPNVVVEAINTPEVLEKEPRAPTEPPSLMADVQLSDQRVAFYREQLPPRSLPVHPSQIYASINGLLLCILIWFLQPLPKQDGVVFLTAIFLYAVSRFLLEGVRSDELGQLGTSLTIAQWVGLGSGAAALVGLAILSRLPARRFWKWQAA